MGYRMRRRRQVALFLLLSCIYICSTHGGTRDAPSNNGNPNQQRKGPKRAGPSKCQSRPHKPKALPTEKKSHGSSGIQGKERNTRGETVTIMSSKDFEDEGLKTRLNQLRLTARRWGREARGILSSELEQVTIKATRPDDKLVKAKHLEALLRPSYEFPPELNVYSPIVRKLWNKMRDQEWRVVVKAIYVLHRLAVEGSAAQGGNLKTTVETLSRMGDPKCKNATKYFDMSQICDISPAPWSRENVNPYKEFIGRYAQYVIIRASDFGPGFTELLDGYTMLLSKDYISVGAVGSTQPSSADSTGSESAESAAGGTGATSTPGGGPLSVSTLNRPCMAAFKDLINAGLRVQFTTTLKAPPALDDEHKHVAPPEIIVVAQLAVAQDLRDAMEAAAAQVDFLSKEEIATEEYPEELERWYAFLENRMPVVNRYIADINKLAEASGDNNKLVAPLSATPKVLERRAVRAEEARTRKKERELAAMREAQERAKEEQRLKQAGHKHSTDNSEETDDESDEYETEESDAYDYESDEYDYSSEEE